MDFSELAVISLVPSLTSRLGFTRLVSLQLEIQVTRFAPAGRSGREPVFKSLTQVTVAAVGLASPGQRPDLSRLWLARLPRHESYLARARCNNLSHEQ